MIYDHRTYKCRPGTINKQLAQYKELGYEAQVRNLGKPLVYAATEIGDVAENIADISLTITE